eukprot:XP_019076977.1 PREDICTED: histone-lysine N-methyltransferase ATXR4 isoform X2 [Vitis vinifera]
MYRYSRWGWQLKRRHSERKLLLGFPFCYSTPTPPENEKLASPGPPPIRVSITEMAGRGVFATRRIGSGDLIHTAKPLVSHPSLSSIHSVCYFCLRKLKPVTSSEDCNVRFCSQECEEQSKVFVAVERKADWSAYDDYCRTRGLKYPLLVKRLACMVVSGVASADCLDILQPASLSSEMISEMGEGFSLLQSAFMKAKARDECMAFLTEQWYINVLARFRINSFRIELAGGSYEDLHSLAAASVETEAAVGNAVYMLPSFYNHDCDFP